MGPDQYFHQQTEVHPDAINSPGMGNPARVKGDVNVALAAVKDPLTGRAIWAISGRVYMAKSPTAPELWDSLQGDGGCLEDSENPTDQCLVYHHAFGIQEGDSFVYKHDVEYSTYFTTTNIHIVQEERRFYFDVAWKIISCPLDAPENGFLNLISQCFISLELESPESPNKLDIKQKLSIGTWQIESQGLYFGEQALYIPVLTDTSPSEYRENGGSMVYSTTIKLFTRPDKDTEWGFVKDIMSERNIAPLTSTIDYRFNRVIFGFTKGVLIAYSLSDPLEIPFETDFRNAFLDIYKIQPYTYQNGEQALIISQVLSTESAYFSLVPTVVIDYDISRDSINSMKITSPIPLEGRIENIVIDDSRGVAFLMGTVTSDGKNTGIIHRYNLETKLLHSSITEGTNTHAKDINLSVGLLYTNLNKLYVLRSKYGEVGPDLDELNMNIYSISTCNDGTCSSCIEDDIDYCGYCISSSDKLLGDDIGCSTLELCTAIDQTKIFGNEISECPAITYTSITRGSTDGGTLVEITGNKDFTDEVQCIFNGQSGEAQHAGNKLECTSPPGIEGTFNLEIKDLDNGGRLYGSVPWEYYDCETAACNDCLFIGSECGHCYTDASCKTHQSCEEISPSLPSSVWDPNGECSYVVNVSPVYLRENSTEIVSISFYGTIEELEYICLFDSISSPVISTIYDDNQTITVTCNSPKILHNLRGVDVNVGVINATNEILFTVDGSSTILYYDCDQVVYDCSNCILFPECSVDGNGRCTSTPISQETDICPRAIPSEDYTASDYISGGTLLSFDTSKFEVFDSGENFTCAWIAYDNEDFELESPANLVGTNLSCTTPSLNPSDVGLYRMIIKVNDEESDILSSDFEFYDCQETHCYTCTNSLYKRCSWCGSCEVDNICGNTTTPPELCPFLDYVVVAKESIPVGSLPGDTIRGKSQVSIYGFNLNINSTTINCVWSMGPIELVSSATIISDTQITCQSPTADSTGVYSLTVKFDGNILLNYLDFIYYDCSSTEGGSSCDSCINPKFPRCTWCSLTCKPKVDCNNANPLSECPTIQKLSKSAILFGDTLEIIGGSRFDPDPVLNYQCLFEGISASEKVDAFIDQSGDVLYCTTPTRSVSKRALPGGNYTVTILLKGEPLSEEKFPIYIFSCPSVTSCQSNCFSESNCVWCSESGTCSANYKCNSKTSRSCATLSMSHLFASIEGNQTISVDMLGMNSSNFDNFEEIECNFGIQKSKAIVIDDDTIECLTPEFDLESDTNFYLSYADASISDETIFGFKDCSTSTTCHSSEDLSCDIRQGCGWCMQDNSCQAELSCGVIKDWESSSCPSIQEISPTKGGSGTEITITGVHFIDGLTIRFNDKEVEAIFVDNQTIRGVAPSGSGTTQVSLWLGTSPYSIDDELFTYNSNAWIAAIVIVPIVLIIIGIIVWKLKGNQTDNRFRLGPPPDFEELAWSGCLEEEFEYPIDELRDFEEALFNDPDLFRAFTSVLGSADHDRASKAIIHAAESREVSLEHLLLAIESEISGTLQAATIFRGNSLASKMFKSYARIIGLPYLYDTMAVFVAQIDHAARQQDILHDRLEEVNDKEGKKTVAANLNLIDLELDINKMDEDAIADLEANTYQLQHICQLMLTNIFRSAEEMPGQYRIIFHRVRDSISEQFPDEQDSLYHAVGGLFFLRFVIPSIFAPHVYGFISEPPSPTSQRQLVLISKVLQNIANLVLPSKKEAFMAALTDFIELNIPKVIDFYEEIMIPPPTRDIIFIEVPRTAKMNALCTLYGMFHSKSDKIKGYFVDNYLEEKGGLVDDIMEKHGAPPPKV
eukprot:TRINITY_DN2364_c0_g2_i1.p1 TRINITY_DN2364_c0_g2~~TRINITY_DN2364_c0_g2_i1.p1  ORF type:complete len:1839 (+),score=361.72 TRINITY_DN2364_c0_g2_i1:78-5519(+)